MVEVNKNIVTQILTKNNILYTEGNNASIVVDTVTIWCQKAKWYNTQSGEKGQGLNSYFKHLQLNGYDINSNI